MIKSVYAAGLRVQLRGDAGYWAAVVREDCETATTDMAAMTERVLSAMLRVQRTLAVTEARMRRFREVHALRRRLFLMNLSRECTDACKAYENELWVIVGPRFVELDKRLAMLDFTLEQRLVRVIK